MSTLGIFFYSYFFFLSNASTLYFPKVICASFCQNFLVLFNFWGWGFMWNFLFWFNFWGLGFMWDCLQRPYQLLLLFLYDFWSLLWNAHFKTGFVIDVYMAIALLNIYWKCNAFDCAIQLFDELPKRNMAIINSGIYHLLCSIPPSLIKLEKHPNQAQMLFFFFLIPMDYKYIMPKSISFLLMLPTLFFEGSISSLYVSVSSFFFLRYWWVLNWI